MTSLTNFCQRLHKLYVYQNQFNRYIFQLIDLCLTIIIQEILYLFNFRENRYPEMTAYLHTLFNYKPCPSCNVTLIITCFYVNVSRMLVFTCLFEFALMCTHMSVCMKFLRSLSMLEFSNMFSPSPYLFLLFRKLPSIIQIFC